MQTKRPEMGIVGAIIAIHPNGREEGILVPPPIQINPMQAIQAMQRMFR